MLATAIGLDLAAIEGMDHVVSDPLTELLVTGQDVAGAQAIVHPAAGVCGDAGHVLS
jgi:hypothetical protein